VTAPRNLRPVAMVAVGYPAERPVAPQKRSFNEIVHYDTF